MNNNEENKVYLNNVVYDLTKIENPHLKKALQQRTEKDNFLHLFRKSNHKDYNAIQVVEDYRELVHTDISGHKEYNEAYDAYAVYADEDEPRRS